MNINIKQIEKTLNYYKETYLEVIEDNFDKQELKDIVSHLLATQKEDGSWSLLDNYRVDSDIRVHYVYYPTYYVTATLIKADLLLEFKENSNEKNALLKGLEFASGRNLAGHGVTATASLLKTFKLYKDAGLYQWMKLHEYNDIRFTDIIHQHIYCFKEGIKTGRTYSDWNVDFKEDFIREINEYEQYFEEYVWYFAYGSNINEERFMRYINACSDTSRPIKSKPYIVPHNIYFASNSSIWEDKAVAFLDYKRKGKALGRIYKIKKTQFYEIFDQEGPKYNQMINLGVEDSIEVFTFTSLSKRKDINTPSYKYVNTIKEGLKQVYPHYTDLVLNTYLYTKILNKNDLNILKTLRESKHGLTVSDIKRTNSINGNIERLYDYHFIKQDARSTIQGLDVSHNDSIVYTHSDYRELIDLLILLNV